MLQAVKWDEGVLSLLDQRLLPGDAKYVTCTDHRQTAQAITDMVVRGAPAIGISGGYGLALAAFEAAGEFGSTGDSSQTLAAATQFLREAASMLASARPTAVNLSWAVERVLDRALLVLPQEGITGAAEAALTEARRIELEDIEANRKIGVNGAAHKSGFNHYDPLQCRSPGHRRMGNGPGSDKAGVGREQSCHGLR